MPEFEWMNPAPAARPAQTTVPMREDELRDRAKLLAKLGYSLAATEKRLRQNLVWEYERVGAPAALKRLSAVVAEVYGHTPDGTPRKKRRSAS